MNRKLQILVAGRARNAIEELAAIAGEQFGCEPAMKHINNGHADPLYGQSGIPDLLILDLVADWQEQLGAICERPAAARPTMLVVGPGNDIDAMRMAMRAGARDYISRPVQSEELIHALSRIEQDEQSGSAGPCQWVSIMGVKGGTGASTVACNLATLASRHEKRTALIDLNLQAGTLAGYLDLEPRNDIFDALDAASDLDQVALEGCMSKTADNLQLLAAPTDQLVLPEQVSPDSISTVFDLVAQNYELVIADLPRTVDHIVASAIEQSDSVFLVMQQSVAAMRETLKVVELLGREFAVNESRIEIIINRFSKNASVTERQIRKSLGDLQITTIPDDERAVQESLDLGIPLVRHSGNTAAARAMKQLGARITGVRPERGSFVSSLTSILRT